MTCPTPDLTALLDGALPPERAEEVRRHLGACPACAAEAARLRSALALLGALPPPPEPSPFFASRLEARLRDERGRPGAWRAWLAAARWRLAVPAAALALVAVLAVTASVHRARQEQAIAAELDLLDDYEAVASLGDVESADDVQVVAHLDELAGEARP